ncbi:MAG: 3-deoxy-D-manno-octulosonic acid transferase [Pseudomonadota bacterium]
MTESPALNLYLLASRLAGPVAPMLLRRREARGKEDPDRMPERLGVAGLLRPLGRLIWLHGASVGEAMSALPLIKALRRDGASVLLTTGTVTSATRVAPLLPEGALHQYAPVDTRQAVRDFLAHWRPNLAIWIESELWPRMIVETSAAGVPMAMVNARVSEKSAKGWARVPGMAKHLLDAFGLILTQDHETLGRLKALGVAGHFSGNLKSLVPVPDCDAEDLALIKGPLAERPIWLAASTHAGDEAAAITAAKRLKDALLILAPRHPARGDEVAEAVSAAGLNLARRSWRELANPDTRVWLADTLGEMGLWYRLASVTFVGGSLSGVGGHTPFEPVSLGSAIVHGPDVSNFGPAYAALKAAGGAVEVADGSALAAEVGRLLSDEPARAAMTEAATGAHKGLKPDIDDILRQLLDLMDVV